MVTFRTVATIRACQHDAGPTDYDHIMFESVEEGGKIACKKGVGLDEN